MSWYGDNTFTQSGDKCLLILSLLMRYVILPHGKHEVVC